MKVFKEKIVLPIQWTFDGPNLVSSVVCGLKALILKDKVLIYRARSSQVIFIGACKGSRENKRKQARKALIESLGNHDQT